MFASAIAGFLPNFSSMNASVPSVGRWKSHSIRPSAKKFFDRSASREVMPSTAFSASTVIDVSATACTWKPSSEPSVSGLASYPAFCRLRSLKASVLTISMAPFGMSLTFAFSAAGFIATSTFGWSPGVKMS